MADIESQSYRDRVVYDRKVLRVTQPRRPGPDTGTRHHHRPDRRPLPSRAGRRPVRQVERLADCGPELDLLLTDDCSGCMTTS